MRLRWMTTALLAIGGLLTACGAEPAPQAPSPDAPAPAEHVDGDEATSVPTAYELARDTIPAKGVGGAEAAWAAGRPAMLLFSASW